MTIGQAIAFSYSTLAASGIETARLDTLVLLEYLLTIDRTHLLASPNRKLSWSQQNVFGDLVERRSKHEPLAYILGKSEFYARDFLVSAAVLVPRPESETMIDLLKTLAQDMRYTAAFRSTGSTPRQASQATLPVDYTIRIADVGTGSGALGITAALELKSVIVELLDIDDGALKVAKMNVIKHTTDIRVKKYDLLPENADYDVLLCNLPYVPNNFNINKAATFEPEIALFAGSDGLDMYRKLFQKLTIVRIKPLLILTEAFPAQHAELATIAAQSGYMQTREDDFIQAFQPKV